MAFFLTAFVFISLKSLYFHKLQLFVLMAMWIVEFRNLTTQITRGVNKGGWAWGACITTCPPPL